MLSVKKQGWWFHVVLVAVLSLSTTAVVVSLILLRYRDTPAETAQNDDAVRSDSDQTFDISQLTSRYSATPPTALIAPLAPPVLVSAHMALPESLPRMIFATPATAPRSPPLCG